MRAVIPPDWKICGSRSASIGGIESACPNDILSGGPDGMGHDWPRNRAGPLAASYGRMGRRMICRTNQSVPRYVATATITSCRTPSTSCAYHNGNVSLSPLVTITEYGSSELSMATAQSRVNTSRVRGASLQFSNAGMNAIARTGHVMSHERFGSTDAAMVLAPEAIVANDSHR